MELSVLPASFVCTNRGTGSNGTGNPLNDSPQGDRLQKSQVVRHKAGSRIPASFAVAEHRCETHTFCDMICDRTTDRVAGIGSDFPRPGPTGQTTAAKLTNFSRNRWFASQ